MDLCAAADSLTFCCLIQPSRNVWAGGVEGRRCHVRRLIAQGAGVIPSATTGGGSRRPHSESARNRTRFVWLKLRLYPPVLSVDSPPPPPLELGP